MSRFDVTSDFEKFKTLLLTFLLGVGKNFAILQSSPIRQIVKARLECSALNDRELRVGYSYEEQDKLIRFVELYFKGSKENKDQERIKKYLIL